MKNWEDRFELMEKAVQDDKLIIEGEALIKSHLISIQEAIDVVETILMACDLVDGAALIVNENTDTMSKEQLNALKMELVNRKEDITMAAEELKELQDEAKKTQKLLYDARRMRSEDNIERFRNSLYNKLEDITKKIESIRIANERIEAIKNEIKEKAPSLFKTLKKAGSFIGKTALVVGAVALAAKAVSGLIRDQSRNAWEFMKKTSQY